MVRNRSCAQVFAMMVMVMFMMMSFGCATPEVKKSPLTVAYASLKTSAEIYDATMNTIRDLYKQGKVTDEQKASVLKYGNEYWRAYHTAVDALDAYYNSTAPEEDRLLTVNGAIATLSTALGSFLEYSSQLAGS